MAADGKVLVVLIQLYSFYARYTEDVCNRAERLSPVAGRGRHIVVHRLEGLGDGVWPPVGVADTVNWVRLEPHHGARPNRALIRRTKEKLR